MKPCRCYAGQYSKKVTTPFRWIAVIIIITAADALSLQSADVWQNWMAKTLSLSDVQNMQTRLWRLTGYFISKQPRLMNYPASRSLISQIADLTAVEAMTASGVLLPLSFKITRTLKREWERSLQGQADEETHRFTEKQGKFHAIAHSSRAGKTIPTVREKRHTGREEDRCQLEPVCI